MNDRDYLRIPAPVNARWGTADHCLVWRLTLNSGGYGEISIDGSKLTAHRAAYVQAGGFIPGDRQLNHLCNRPYCVQPAHLYPGTAQDNADDRAVYRKDIFFLETMYHHIPGDRLTTDFQRRIARNVRYNTMPAWLPPVQDPQGELIEWRCPGHLYDISAGPEATICRICEETDDQRFQPERTIVSELISELHPALRYHPPLWQSLEGQPLTGPHYLEWRENAARRTGRLQSAHPIATCSCIHCGKDRKTLETALAEALTGREMQILKATDRAGKAARDVLTEARQSVIDIQSGPECEMSEKAKTRYRSHLPDCRQTADVGKSHTGQMDQTTFLLLLEAAKGLDATTCDELEEAIRQIEDALNRDMAWEIPGTVNYLGPATKKAHSQLTAVASQATVSALTGKAETDQITAGLTTKCIAQYGTLTIRSMIGYDLNGRSQSMKCWQHPHQYCANTAERPDAYPAGPLPMKNGSGFTADHLMDLTVWQSQISRQALAGKVTP